MRTQPFLSCSLVFAAVTAAIFPSMADEISIMPQLEPMAGSAAAISQKYVAGGGDGRNQAVQLQAGARNSAAITQEGSAHSAVQAQAGSDNSSVIKQYGAGRAAAHIQIGDGHSAAITQSGGAGDGSAGVTVTQFNFGAGGR